MSFADYARAASDAVAARFGDEVTIIPRVSGEMGSAADPSRTPMRIRATYTVASSVGVVDYPKADSAGGTVARPTDEVNIPPNMADFMIWRPRRGDHVLSSQVKAGEQAEITSVLPGNRGGLRLTIDRRRLGVKV